MDSFPLDLLHLVFLIDEALIVPDPLARVVLDAGVVVLLAANEDLLLARLVLEAQFVVIVVSCRPWNCAILNVLRVS